MLSDVCGLSRTPRAHESQPQRLHVPSAGHMREASPQSPQQEQRYLRDVFRERGDLLGDAAAAAAARARRAAVTNGRESGLAGRACRRWRQRRSGTRASPEDTTAPRKSAAALRATLADGWAAALSSKRRDAPHRAASTPQPSEPSAWTPLQQV